MVTQRIKNHLYFFKRMFSVNLMVVIDYLSLRKEFNG